MPIPAELLKAFPPSATRLLDVARRDLDDELVMWIARADYGDRANEHFPQLQQIRNTGQIPRLNNWLGEVLNLSCWDEPDSCVQSRFEAGPKGVPGHRARFFACAVVLKAAVDPACHYPDGEITDWTIAQGLKSAMAFGEESLAAMAGFLLSCLEQNADPWEHVPRAFAVLVVACRLRKEWFTDSLLEGFGEWMVGVHVHVASTLRYGSTAFLDSKFWQVVAAEFRRDISQLESFEARYQLELCIRLFEA